MPRKDDLNQLTLSFAPTITPRGDGSFIVVPGKPLLVNDLSVRDFARHFSVSPKSIYRWISEDVIPREHVRAAGMRRLRIAAEAIPLLEAKFRELH